MTDFPLSIKNSTLDAMTITRPSLNASLLLVYYTYNLFFDTHRSSYFVPSDCEIRIHSMHHFTDQIVTPVVADLTSNI